MLGVVSSATLAFVLVHFLHTWSHSCGGKPEGCCRFNWVCPKYPSWNASRQVLWHGPTAPKKQTHGDFFVGSSNLESSVSKKPCDTEAFPIFHVIMYCIAFHQAEMRSANTFNWQLISSTGKHYSFTRIPSSVGGNKILKATPNLVLSDIDITESVHRTREGSDLYIWNLYVMSFLPICSQTMRINGEVQRGWQSRCQIAYPFTKLDTHGDMSKNGFPTHIEHAHLLYAYLKL